MMRRMIPNVTNGTFCVLPWIHMHIWPDGRTFPCCASDSGMPDGLGNTNTETLEEIWNGKRMRAMRRTMLRGGKLEECSRCYDLESSGLGSLRQHSNHQYLERHIDSVSNTEADGTVPEVNMAYLDIRWSNICNLRCRTCGHVLSSGWYDDQVALQPGYSEPRILNVNGGDRLWSQLEPYLHQTEEVYFAGGESILTDEHYRLLDHWLSIGKTDVRLRYTTNFTVIGYKQRDLFGMWSKFSDVRVAASLDASHARGEFLRKNMDWDAVVANRRRMLEEVPSVYFEITPAVSLMNAIHLPDFHREWVEQGLLGVDNVRINLLTYPAHTSVRCLPQRLKSRVRSAISSHAGWLSENGASGDSIAQWNGIVSHMDSENNSHKLSEFKSYHDAIDSLRGERMMDVFPELDGLYDEL